MATKDRVRAPGFIDNRASEVIAKIAEIANSRLIVVGAWPELSEATKEFISRRRPPSSLHKYATFPSALDVMAADILEYTECIRLYAYIDLYRLKRTETHYLQTAFSHHMWRLRRSELYMIEELGIDILKFMAVLAENVQMRAKDQSSAFRTAFKLRFRSDLIDRHKMVHRHERPSMASRIMEVLVVTNNRKELKETLDAMAVQLENLAESAKKTNIDLPKAIEAAQEKKDLRRQADDAWQLFRDHALATFKVA